MRGVYPHHGSELGEFFLCSDSVIPTFTRWDLLRRITELFTEEENEAFRTTGRTIPARHELAVSTVVWIEPWPICSFT